MNGLFFNAFALGKAAKRSATVLSNFFYYSSGFTIVASVFISMRLLAEERQAGTLPLLYSSPVRDRDIVLGKYLAGLAFLARVPGVHAVHAAAGRWCTARCPSGHIVAGYLGLLLLGSASLAVGTFGSALARNQVIAAILSAVMLVALILCWLLARITEQPLARRLQRDVAVEPALPAVPGGPRARARRRLLPRASPTWRCSRATRVLEARRWR